MTVSEQPTESLLMLIAHFALAAVKGAFLPMAAVVELLLCLHAVLSLWFLVQVSLATWLPWPAPGMALCAHLIRQAVCKWPEAGF